MERCFHTLATVERLAGAAAPSTTAEIAAEIGDAETVYEPRECSKETHGPCDTPHMWPVRAGSSWPHSHAARGELCRSSQSSRHPNYNFVASKSSLIPAFFSGSRISGDKLQCSRGCGCAVAEPRAGVLSTVTLKAFHRMLTQVCRSSPLVAPEVYNKLLTQVVSCVIEQVYADFLWSQRARLIDDATSEDVFVAGDYWELSQPGCIIALCTMNCDLLHSMS